MTASSHSDNKPIIIALDFDNETAVMTLIEKLDPKQCRLKVGKQLFTLYGPPLVKRLQAAGFDVFLDLKFHDIPNTVAAACRAAADLGVWMVNVHASGGRQMLEAAQGALSSSGASRPLLTAVTILTSLAEQDIHEVGFSGQVAENVLRLAKLTASAGLDGVVCSPQEISLLREHLPASFCLVTPGIRPASAAADDQKRVMSPHEALEKGANYLVIGRPITQAADPQIALQEIQQNLASF